MTDFTYRNHPPGHFADCAGWNLCWSYEEIPQPPKVGGFLYRFTVTAVRDGMARCVFRDAGYPYKPSESSAVKTLAVLESQVRHLVEEIESLEESWRVNA